jgi:hypothetical protein
MFLSPPLKLFADTVSTTSLRITLFSRCCLAPAAALEAADSKTASKQASKQADWPRTIEDFTKISLFFLLFPRHVEAAC